MRLFQITFSTLFFFLLLLNFNVSGQERILSPIEINLVRENFATILNDKHPNNRIGYRFHEHEPLTYGKVPMSNKKAKKFSKQAKKALSEFKETGNIFTYTHKLPKSEHWVRQDWHYYMKPVSDGIEILLVVDTYEEGLPEYYGIQQCFRMSGVTNEPWRNEIAKTPAFSEYDLWDQLGGPEKSLTHVFRQGKWEALPATKNSVGARTPLGQTIDHKRTEGNLMEKVGPYEAQMLAPIDYGLVTRANENKTWVSGIYWENTSHVTNHHPADCLHAIVNIGDIPPHSSQVIRGKIYWFEGGLKELFNHYKQDFPNSGH